MYEVERDVINEGYEYLIGIDEVGRGPLAGPVVSAAVSIESGKFNKFVDDFESKIGDSKKLTVASREKAYKEIKKKMKVGIGLCSSKTIDEVNILEATKLSMWRSFSCLSSTILDIEKFNSCVLIDGEVNVDIPLLYLNIPQGDSRCFLISCASIVAKVVRDEIMLAYASLYPDYGFFYHKGYGTKKHIANIRKFGISPIHRKSFSPCKSNLGNE